MTMTEEKRKHNPSILVSKIGICFVWHGLSVKKLDLILYKLLHYYRLYIKKNMYIRRELAQIICTTHSITLFWHNTYLCMQQFHRWYTIVYTFEKNNIQVYTFKQNNIQASRIFQSLHAPIVWKK